MKTWACAAARFWLLKSVPVMLPGKPPSREATPEAREVLLLFTFYCNAISVPIAANSFWSSPKTLDLRGMWGGALLRTSEASFQIV